jgi:hypothetical protein
MQDGWWMDGVQTAKTLVATGCFAYVTTYMLYQINYGN